MKYRTKEKFYFLAKKTSNNLTFRLRKSTDQVLLFVFLLRENKSDAKTKERGEGEKKGEKRGKKKYNFFFFFVAIGFFFFLPNFYFYNFFVFYIF